MLGWVSTLMGDYLGIPCVVDFSCLIVSLLIPSEYDPLRLSFACIAEADVYSHTTLKAPVPI